MRIGHIPVAKTVLLALIANGIPMTPAQIHDYITNCSRDSTITLDYTARILSGLARHPDGVVTLSTKDDYSPEPMYAINVKRSRELMLHRVLFGYFHVYVDASSDLAELWELGFGICLPLEIISFGTRST